LSELVDLIASDIISGKIAKDVFALLWEENRKPSEIIEEKGLKQVTDTTAIEVEVNKVLDAHPKMVQDYLNGKDKLLGFFVGQVMKATQGKVNPLALNQVLVERLNQLKGE
jgi:aspartyl-tRNA(Asn)/glutamyl-tRNA(Gln) amidotransferase subunit B